VPLQPPSLAQIPPPQQGRSPAVPYEGLLPSISGEVPQGGTPYANLHGEAPHRDTPYANLHGRAPQQAVSPAVPYGGGSNGETRGREPLPRIFGAAPHGGGTPSANLHGEALQQFTWASAVGTAQQPPYTRSPYG
jgi:hypothetical protein